MNSGFHWQPEPEASWPANNEKQVSRPSHVRFAQDATRNSGQAWRCCGSAPRVRLPLPWLPRWMLQKRPSEAENHHGMRNRELLGGWEGCCHTERRPIAAKDVTMHNVSRDAAVYLICELCWNIYSGSRVWVSIDVFPAEAKVSSVQAGE